MIAKFFAVRIMNGKSTFERVPVQLKNDVQVILEEEGYGHLAEGGGK